MTLLLWFLIFYNILYVFDLFDFSLGLFWFPPSTERAVSCPEGISSFVTRGNTRALGACRQGSRNFTVAKLESRGGLNDPKFCSPFFSDELLTCCSCCSHPKTSARPREDMRLENWYSEGFWFFLLRFAPSYIEWDCCLVFIRYCNLTFCMWHGLKPSFRTTTPCFSCVSTGVSTLAFGNTTSVYEKWVLLKRLLAGNIPLLEFLESDIPTGTQVVRWTTVM